MKFVRFSVEGEAAIRSGQLEEGIIHEWTGHLFGSRVTTGNQFPLEAVQLKAPLEPRHIVGIGKNFSPAGEEKQPIPEMPILFFKPLTTVIGPGDAIKLPSAAAQVKFESELAVIIGAEASHIKTSDVKDYIFGYTIGNDLGAFNYFHPEGHWTIGKAFDTFCPLGPYIETQFDYNSAHIQARVNGELLQDAGMDRIIMPVDQQIAYISSFMTLKPGDVILTGTPAGAQYVKDGDSITCSIEGLGHLHNPVILEEGS
ncbi:fumarylacetoacetate hydrolase family protein [Paenibacillus sp. IITD108]|uniref:fumarylacetoacetate hydrolase family protein n=1 Tax=Paenibacillus sp. IITD108 TaxID=3116649 RepID=UPI002F410BB2